MQDAIYVTINEFLLNELREMDLYIQEGSGGYYIATRKINDHSGGTFVNRLAQVVEDEGTYKLCVKDRETGQWGEYKFYDTIDECLEAMKASLLSEYEREPVVEPPTPESFYFNVTRLEFSCWSCGARLFKINGGDTTLSIDWIQGLESIEIQCPKCHKLMLYDLTQKRDTDKIFFMESDPSRLTDVPYTQAVTPIDKRVPIQDITPLIKIDFYDLIWRLKDHTHGSEHYLNLRTGRLERINTQELSREELREYDSYPWSRIIPVPSKEAFGAMEKFVETIDDKDKKELLEQSLLGSKPFRNFKFALQKNEDLHEAWIQFENAFYEGKAREWLDSIGIKYELLV